MKKAVIVLGTVLIVLTNFCEVKIGLKLDATIRTFGFNNLFQ